MADPGLVLFLNAGDPGFGVLERVVQALDEEGVDWLELAVPFPDSVTDGPTIHRSARRALDAGTDLGSTLAFVARIKPRLTNLKVALLADWRHTVRALDIDGFLAAVREAGCDGLLMHGVPPRMRTPAYERAHAAGVAIVSTCYAGSSPSTLAEAARHATAYVYLVSRYGRSEGSGGPDIARLAPVIAALRELTPAPIATGFGVRTAADVRAVAQAGSDAAIVGSACVACLEQAVAADRDPVAAMRGFVAGLRA
jgi:tryptophan synthase alpha chain